MRCCPRAEMAGASDRICSMTTKERLHKIIDELPEAQAAEVLDFASERASVTSATGAGENEHAATAEEREDPVIAAFRDAPEDDEPWTEEDEAAMAEVRADEAAGVPTIPLADIKAKYGLA